MQYLSLLALAIPFVAAQSQNSSDSDEVYQWDDAWVTDIQIHDSCNHSQYLQIYEAWEETLILSNHAKMHTAKNGNNSEIFQKWFGNDTVSAEVVGWFDNIVNQDKTGVIFRCDNPDGKCESSGWAGHWRGENATDETVICDLSYTSKQRLSQVCTQGWTVKNGKTTAYWASDFLHRLWHTDVVGQGVVGHYADTYDDCLELAQTNPSEAVRNSASLRWYALEVYAYDIAVPGEGCSGEDAEEDDHSDHSDHSHSATSSEESKTTTTLATGAECHTHADGVVHCS